MGKGAEISDILGGTLQYPIFAETKSWRFLIFIRGVVKKLSIFARKSSKFQNLFSQLLEVAEEFELYQNVYWINIDARGNYGIISS